MPLAAPPPHSPPAPDSCQSPAGTESAAPVPAASQSPPAPRRKTPATGTAACTPTGAASAASRMPCLTPLLREYCSCPFELFFQQLFLVQIRVIPAAFQQFLMRSRFDNRAVFHHHNLVRIPHG